MFSTPSIPLWKTFTKHKKTFFYFIIFPFQSIYETFVFPYNFVLRQVFMHAQT